MARSEKCAVNTEGGVFATNLREIMKIRGTNQSRLAKQIEQEQGKIMQRQTIAQYMSGLSKPDTERLTMLCKALEVTADYLLGLDDCPSINPDDQIANRTTGLSYESIKALQYNPEPEAMGIELEVINDMIPSKTFWNMVECIGDLKRVMQRRELFDDDTYLMDYILFKSEVRACYLDIVESLPGLIDEMYGYRNFVDSIPTGLTRFTRDDLKKLLRGENSGGGENSIGN